MPPQPTNHVGTSKQNVAPTSELLQPRPQHLPVLESNRCKGARLVWSRGISRDTPDQSKDLPSFVQVQEVLVTDSETCVARIPDYVCGRVRNMRPMAPVNNGRQSSARLTCTVSSCLPPSSLAPVLQSDSSPWPPHDCSQPLPTTTSRGSFKIEKEGTNVTIYFETERGKHTCNTNVTSFCEPAASPASRHKKKRL